MPVELQTSSLPEVADEAGDKSAVTLRLLTSVHDNSAVTQRGLARELGVALGIANATLRRCVEKGLIKVSQAPARRYAYYLTPRGFAEKSRLTAQYLTDSLKFFRLARKQCEVMLAECAASGWRRVVFAGAGELAEIARLCALDAGVELIAIIAPERQDRAYAGVPVEATLVSLALDAFDAVLITDVRAPQATFDVIAEAARTIGLAEERVLAPKLLRISKAPPSDLDGETSEP